MPGAVERPGNVSSEERQIDVDGIVTRQVFEATCEKGLQREMSPVLLPDENDQRSSVDPGRCERGYRVAKARRRVEKGDGGLATSERPAGGKPDDRRLVQRQHEPEVIRKTCEKRHFGRPGIAEDRCQASVPKDIEGRVADSSLAHSRASIA